MVQDSLSDLCVLCGDKVCICIVTSIVNCTYVALQRECISILNILILEIIEVYLCKVGINGDGIMITNTGQPVIVHCCCRTENMHVSSAEDERVFWFLKMIRSGVK